MMVPDDKTYRITFRFRSTQLLTIDVEALDELDAEMCAAEELTPEQRAQCHAVRVRCVSRHAPDAGQWTRVDEAHRHALWPRPENTEDAP